MAIKILPSEVSGDARLRARFEREARALSALNHPQICTVYDVGEADGAAAGPQGKPVQYLVMEYCEGKTLAERLLAGRLPIEQVLQYGVEIAAALNKAHRSGILPDEGSDDGRVIGQQMEVNGTHGSSV